MRMDPFPATLSGPGGFRLLFLTFVSWDVIKYRITGGGIDQNVEVEATQKSTDAVYTPTRSNVRYRITAKGCAGAIGGGTSYCSPESRPLEMSSAVNTTSLRTFLRLSAIDTRQSVGLRALLRTAGRGQRLRAVMGLV
ncbi:hypothetical protein [Nocardia colli]|uniref:hypothetical protein n=1 Tax=Nocardia colli TaxID=2545717 RepID=UPI0035E2C9FB